MKISKLFHWLYGAVMLLPLLAIGVTCGYAIFNKNAKDSYYGDTINQENIVSITNNFVENKKYYFSFGNIAYTEQTEVVIYVTEFECNFISAEVSSTVDNIKIRSQSGSTYMLFYNGSTYLNDRNMAQNNSYSGSFTFLSKNDVDLVSNYQVFYYKEYISNSYLSEVFYYSLDRVTQSSYFSWAYDSFLVAPFSYIVSLFSMPTNSPVVMLMSYWLAISIIWLVFDLVMYVPLLVHRWLDKGAIQ